MDSSPELLRRAAPPVAVLAGWFLVFCKVGAGRVLGWQGALEQIARMPHTFHDPDRTLNYVDYSPLPAAFSRFFGATSGFSNTALQTVAMVTITTVTVGVVSWRNPIVGWLSVAGLFASPISLYALRAAGGYDNLLLALLLAAVFASDWRLAVGIGVLLGLTHSELAALAGIELLGLSWCGLGPKMKARLQLMGGIVAGRVGVMVWIIADNDHGTRLDFMRAFGMANLLRDGGSKWLLILWTAAAGGWLVIAVVLVRRRSKRLLAVTFGSLLANAVVVALTTDESRIAGISTLAIVVILSAYGARDRLHMIVCLAAVAITAASPYVAVYLGHSFHNGRPFFFDW